ESLTKPAIPKLKKPAPKPETHSHRSMLVGIGVAMALGIGLRFIQIPVRLVPVAIGIALAASVLLLFPFLCNPPEQPTSSRGSRPGVRRRSREVPAVGAPIAPKSPEPKKEINSRLATLTRRPPSRPS